MNKIIIIYGPTAVGKSDVAIRLAKKIDAEIISADSMQIYKDLNIGSAKITKEEMQGVVHHLLDIKDSLDNFSAYEFCEHCKSAINDIESRKKNVIICGGTGLYIKALTENYNYAQTDKNKDFREKLNKLCNDELYNNLLNIDEVWAKQIGSGDKKRLIRALEILENGGKAEKSDFDDRYVIFGLVDDRQALYERINKRVDIMLKKGLVEEVKYLVSRGATIDNQSMKAIGYKELLPYINGEDSLENCVEKIKQLNEE